MLLQHTAQGPFLRYCWHAETPSAQMWSQCHGVKKILAWFGFSPEYWFKHEPFTSNSLPSPLAQWIRLLTDTMQTDHSSKTMCPWSVTQGEAIYRKLLFWDTEGDYDPESPPQRSILPSAGELDELEKSVWITNCDPPHLSTAFIYEINK